MILGINDGHDAGIALLDDFGEVLYAANEERFTGVKQQWGMPWLALDAGLRHVGATGGDINTVAFGFEGLVETQSSSSLQRREVGGTRRLFTLASAVAGPLMETGLAREGIRLLAGSFRRNSADVRLLLKKLDFHPALRFVNHHTAHAASAYFSSGFEDAAVITIDAGGDGVSGSLWAGEGGKLIHREWLSRIHSLGDFWLAVTLLCGFDPDKHGGKITGLAAYRPNPEALQALKGLYEPVEGRFAIRNRHHLFWHRLVHRLRKVMAPYNREEIAWAAQRLLEELVVHLVREGIRQTGHDRVAVAGGVFANVRLNMEIVKQAGVSSFFVHPHMGDGGTAMGAAWQVLSQRRRVLPRAFEHVFFGDLASVETEESPEGLVSSGKLNLEELVLRTAEALQEGKVVAVTRGRMEYGPRALCHRSILHHPFDPTVMDWLNERLDRTEFMPFAPVLRERDLHRYFKDVESTRLAARFMTVCLKATAKARNEAPAIVHVDNTARPQTVARGTDPFMYDLLTEFGRRSGTPILINTSFNRHEQPIVRTERQAFEELRRGVVDWLVLDDAIWTRGTQ